MAWSRVFRVCMEVAQLIVLGALLKQWYSSGTEDAVGFHLSAEQQSQLSGIAQQLVANGRGVLAADESIDTIGKRFSDVHVENSAENRRNYRQMLFTATNLSDYISGIIFHEETFYQKANSGQSLVQIAHEAAILVGIKLDLGLTSLSGQPDETITQGIDTLHRRATRFHERGAQFAKWRSVLHVGERTPSRAALVENARLLAAFARIVQQVGLVPIVEPEVLSNGDHSLERVQRVTEQTLAHLYSALETEQVYLKGTLLKPNMVTPSLKYTGKKVSHQQIANATLEVLMKTVPEQMPGILFLSGGQSEHDATANLNAINQIAQHLPPWKLSFSFGRALQNSALRVWQQGRNFAAQETFLKRAKLNSLAAQGIYDL